MRFLNPKTFMLPSNDINRVWIEPSDCYQVASKEFFKREKASARASSDRFLPILKPNIQNNAINCTNLGKQQTLEMLQIS